MQLDLSSNKLSSVPWDLILEQTSLKKLNVSRNRIQSIPNEVSFKRLKKLAVLDLSSNLLSKFPAGFVSCKSLKVLKLIHNQIQIIPLEFYESEQLQESLEELNLSSNPLREVSAQISHFKNLKSLGLANTKVSKLPPQIADLPLLEQLVCQGAPLVEPEAAIVSKGVKEVRKYFEGQRGPNLSEGLQSKFGAAFASKFTEAVAGQLEKGGDVSAI